MADKDIKIIPDAEFNNVLVLLNALGIKRTEITVEHLRAAQAALEVCSAHRRYSVADIDRMRLAIWGTYHVWAAPKAPDVEDRLRTYMLNGTRPEELEAARHPTQTKEGAMGQLVEVES